MFHTSGAVNKHKARVRDRENSHTIVEALHTSKKVVVWCGTHKSKIAGPCTFSEPAVAVEFYKRMLQYCDMTKVLDICLHLRIFCIMMLLHIGSLMYGATSTQNLPSARLADEVQ